MATQISQLHSDPTTLIVYGDGQAPMFGNDAIEQWLDPEQLQFKFPPVAVLRKLDLTMDNDPNVFFDGAEPECLDDESDSEDRFDTPAGREVSINNGAGARDTLELGTLLESTSIFIPLTDEEQKALKASLMELQEEEEEFESEANLTRPASTLSYGSESSFDEYSDSSRSLTPSDTYHGHMEKGYEEGFESAWKAYGENPDHIFEEDRRESTLMESYSTVIPLPDPYDQMMSMRKSFEMKQNATLQILKEVVKDSRDMEARLNHEIKNIRERQAVAMQEMQGKLDKALAEITLLRKESTTPSRLTSLNVRHVSHTNTKKTGANSLSARPKLSDRTPPASSLHRGTPPSSAPGSRKHSISSGLISSSRVNTKKPVSVASPQTTRRKHTPSATRENPPIAGKKEIVERRIAC